LFLSILIVGLFYILWDSLFTKLGVWGFNTDHLIGKFIFNLPVEEYLFFICVPYAGVFTFHVFRTLMPGFVIREKYLRLIVFSLAIVLLVTGLVNSIKLYTCSTFLFATFSIFISFVFFRQLLPHFLLSFAAILIPFFIMNGILTGMWIDKEVVWYNNEENLGIRLLTIPLEDVFYGMALILWNVNLTYKFKS